MKSNFCDGIQRRQFIKLGGLALGGLSLPQLLRAESVAKIGSSQKAIIMIYLPGGPSHLDMYDLKPDAPSEIRGEFKPIGTNVPGIQICEHMPRLARMMDKCVILRSLIGSDGLHNGDICVSGWPRQGQDVQGGHPSLGAVVSKVYGQKHLEVPSFVGFAPHGSAIGGNPGHPGFLGAAYAPFLPSSRGAEDISLNGITLDRLSDRRKLRDCLDAFRRDIDISDNVSAFDHHTQNALKLLTSSKLIDALDLRKEDPKVVERYGRGGPPADMDFSPYYMDQFLLARRLVEVGVRCVTISFGLWDTHGLNFTDLPGHGMKYSLPLLDQGIATLVQDLNERGLLDDVSVIAWGEFGRSPSINPGGGRDHWPQVSCALLAGGGMRSGQVIGSTDHFGGSVEEKPIHFQGVFASLYRNLGIDAGSLALQDAIGRPQPLLETHEAIKELYS